MRHHVSFDFFGVLWISTLFLKLRIVLLFYEASGLGETKTERWGEMEDWKKFLSGDFLMNVIGVIVGLWIWNKFLKSRL